MKNEVPKKKDNRSKGVLLDPDRKSPRADQGSMIFQTIAQQALEFH
ncbi:hypothetical protein [Leptolyngbya sp. 7M]|nr:hypothetical protein [Leptolyngbya sp. 7M]QYO62802.1 hypothetical protein JVX88_22620 [Leptolyngbya sp. 7M]